MVTHDFCPSIAEQPPHSDNVTPRL